MDDLISRQAAISALKDNVIEIGGDDFAEKGVHEDDIDAIIDKLPSVHPNLAQLLAYECGKASAQPERTCVNCGRTVNNGGWYADGRTRCPIEEHYALPKDGFCHLWEKRNVTDDDYPERREE